MIERLLLETGDRLLLETGDVLLLESSGAAAGAYYPFGGAVVR